MPASFSTTAKAAALASNLNPATAVCSVPMAMYLARLFKMIPAESLVAPSNCDGAFGLRCSLVVEHSDASAQE